MEKKKKLPPYEIAIKILEKHQRFLKICYSKAPEMSDCGRYFIGPEEDIVDDGENAGIYYHTKDGGEGPYFCFWFMSFEDA